MNEDKIIETLKYISQFVENRYDEGLGDYLHIVIGRTDINVIDETIYLLERKQKEIERYKKEIKNLQKELEEKTTIIMAGAEKVKQLEKEIEELHKEINQRIKLKLENEKCAEKDFVYKGKIKEKIKELSKKQDFKVGLENYTIKILKELLEGK